MFNYKGALVSLLLVLFVNSYSYAVIEESKIKGLSKTKSESVDKTQVKNSKIHHVTNQKLCLGVSEWLY